MKNINIIISVVFLVALIGAILTLTLEKVEAPTEVVCTMDAFVCPDGTSVGRVPPTCTFAPCPESTIPDDVQAHIDAKSNLIVLKSPLPNSVISSPVTVMGKARGNWFFEASFPVVVVDWDGLIIGTGIAEAQSEWMTTDFVPFKANISFDLPADTPYRRGALILRKDNPSGLPENDDALEIPIRF